LQIQPQVLNPGHELKDCAYGNLPYLQAEAQEYLAGCDCPDYLRKAERRLAEESERVRNYLDPGSDAKITRVVETELIQKQVRGAPPC